VPAAGHRADPPPRRVGRRGVRPDRDRGAAHSVATEPPF
jgi:hypothetical protein